MLVLLVVAQRALEQEARLVLRDLAQRLHGLTARGMIVVRERGLQAIELGADPLDLIGQLALRPQRHHRPRAAARHQHQQAAAVLGLAALLAADVQRRGDGAQPRLQGLGPATRVQRPGLDRAVVAEGQHAARKLGAAGRVQLGPHQETARGQRVAVIARAHVGLGRAIEEERDQRAIGAGRAHAPVGQRAQAGDGGLGHHQQA